jgi:peptide-methionine (S)-S-oxide reductase
MTNKIGFGGGCHWCTEGVFQSLKGVLQVDQGWIQSTGKNTSPSEAVVVHFSPEVISLSTLIEIHLLTHSSSSDHSKRKKYRSAVYCFNDTQRKTVRDFIEMRNKTNQTVITQVLPFSSFELNSEEFLNYYQTRKEAPFCQKFISPKLEQLFISHAEFLE